jgi:hypothetical protein
LTVLAGLLFPLSLAAHPVPEGDPDSPITIRIGGKLPDNKVEITEEGQFRVIRTNGIPDHKTGDFPGRGNPNEIREQQEIYRIPLQPRLAQDFTQVPQGKFGVAVNGVPFDPGTAEYWKNDRNWHIEAIADGKGRLGLDGNNAHVQPNGAYHYHGVPWGLIEKLEKSGKKEPLLVGWAGDGFPIYYQKEMRASYRLKSGRRPDGKDGPGGRYDGEYTTDYEYAEGSGDLDEANGKAGPTPEYPDGTYHYYVTETFPYVPRMFRGEASERFLHQPGGPGGGPGGRPPGPPGGPDDRPPPPPF